MFGANILVVESLGLLIGQLHHLAGSVSKSFVHTQLLRQLLKETACKESHHQVSLGRVSGKHWVSFNTGQSDTSSCCLHWQARHNDRFAHFYLLYCSTFRLPVVFNENSSGLKDLNVKHETLFGVNQGLKQV